MKTIRERAREMGCVSNGCEQEHERVLRELVEEIAAASRPGFYGDAIRHCFLGPPSAEEVVERAWVDHDVGSRGEHRARIAVRALRDVGLLKEGA